MKAAYSVPWGLGLATLASPDALRIMEHRPRPMDADISGTPDLEIP